MKIRPYRFLLALTVVALLAVGLLFMRAELLMRRFAELQRTFDGNPLDPEFYAPPWMPRSMDEWLANLAEKLSADDGAAYHLKNRLRLTLGAELPTIRLTAVKSIRSDFGTTLRQFSNATSVVVWFSSQTNGLTEADATRICEALRDMPNLHYVDLIGVQFTDFSLSPLAGHPKLETLRLPARHITGASIPTFVSMPSLNTLLLMAGTGSAHPSDETLAITKALSGKVIVQQR